MKKKLLIFIGLLALTMAAVIISAPLLIESQKVQEQVLRRINSWYVVDASVKNVTFTWFPFPHVKLEQVEVLHQDFAVTCPIATLYPSWKILLGLSSLGRVHIADPVIEAHSFSAADEEVEEAVINLPNMKIQIKNGTLLVAEQRNNIFASQRVSLDKISATLTVRGNKGKFSWESAASFAKKISFSGEFGKTGNNSIQGEVKNLRPTQILSKEQKTLLTPLEKSSSFSFLVMRNLNGLNLSMQGDIPDFSLSRLDTTENFKLDQGDLSLHLGNQNTFSLTITDLLVNEPNFRINGEIGRSFPADQEEANIKIDLKAQDIDLTAVRQKVLSLLPDSSVTQTVCDIVQGGTAHSASYFFDAPLKSFEDVSSMTIEVDIADSDIHLADIPLDLKNAKGPIIIKNGDLSGKDITTWVGDARGTNGSFLVGLADDKYGLLVDVDIDANLNELPSVLRSLLDDENVVHELGMVQGSGRAHGHLHIADDLRDFNILVNVDRYDDAELRYERLSWPLHPESGTLQVSDTSVSWENIKAKMGSHSILETSGHLNWDVVDVPLTIDSLHGLFDANTLFLELLQYPVLKDAFSGVLDSIQGSVEVAAGTLSGPFFKTAEYTYSFDTKLKDVFFKSPTLAEKVLIEKGRATIDHGKIQIVASSGTLLGHELNVSGELFHTDWHNWNGNVQINGVLGDKHFSWLNAKDVFPSLIIPRPPYRVSSMNIRWDDQLFTLSSKIISSDETTSLGLDIKNHDNFFSGSFQVKSPADKASFTLQWHDKNETFNSSFKGNISGTSLHALLNDKHASFDKISGDFTLRTSKDNNKTLLAFTGDLVGRDVQWTWGRKKSTFSIPTINLATEGPSLLRIKKLETVFNNESLTATGTFASQPGAGHFDLALSSPPSLTTTNIENFQDDLDHFLYTTLALPKEQDLLGRYDISGLLSFNADSLIIPFGRKGENGASQQRYRLPFTPLQGTYTFNQTDSELNLQNSQVCGVGVNGQLNWHGPKETSKIISLMTPVAGPLQFKEFLSCFNFDGVIEGPLEISGRIHSDTTICKRGGLLLSSRKGTIKKFVALAKTLSLINITGLSGSIWKDGFYYNAMEISGNICDNIFTIDKAFIDGDGVDVVATGEINLSTMEYNLTFFVVPFATINGLVTKVPLVGRVLGGKEGRIVSVPVKVTGPLDDPNVTVLSPKAIGEATGKWILDTITLPFGWMIPQKTEGNESELPGQVPTPPAATVPESSELPVQ